MRNTLPLLSRPADTPYHPSDVPSIRLVAATPSASGISSEASTSMNSSWTSVPALPSPLAPKADPARKRLVPKKSKLGLLGGKDRQKDRGKDLSDVVRRVGGGSTSRRGGGFEIYVDPTDPEIGEIVMVKKKKSRGGLDGLRWGSGGSALEEVTNVPSVPQPVTAITKVKAEEKEKDKWWTLGRGRKDSKEKEKEKAREKSETRPQPPRSKTPEPFKAVPETQSRARFNSLDSGMLLTTAPTSLNTTDYNSRNTSSPLLHGVNPVNEERPPAGGYSRSATPTFGGLLAPPSQFDGIDSLPGNNNQNSIALRAMRSVRSMARIGSWAQLKNGTGPGDEVSQKEVEKKGKDKVKAKSKDKDEPKKKTKKEKSEKKEDKSKTQRIRNSTSSFEAGNLTSSPQAKASLGKKKRSILGLGLPSTMRLPAVRSGSTTSSIGVASGPDANRLSVESAVVIAGRMRSGSTLSTGSSLRPLSTTSSVSRASSSSSGASIRWDEAGLETVKELRRKEKETRRQSIEDAETDAKRKKANRESRRSSEGRRRTPIVDVFPEIQEGSPEPATSIRTVSGGAAPLLTLEEATSDGHECMDEESILTPMKRARPRPLSEQLLGRKRPTGIHEDDGEGVISILSAATNDLAQLINHLDLEATPGATPTPESSPWKRPAGFQFPDACQDSPTKKTLRSATTSISSLRPYAQSRVSSSMGNPVPANAQLLEQQIAPWPVLNSFFVRNELPAKSDPPAEIPKNRLTHKRTLSPSGYFPEPSPPPALRPLRPAKSRNMIISSGLKPLGPPPSMDLPPVQSLSPTNPGRAPSSLTFGSRSSSRAGDSSISSFDDIHKHPRNPALRPTHGHSRNRSSLLSSQAGGSQGSIAEEELTTSRPLAPGARRQLGMKGTMGGSDVSAYAVDDLDASDPDSDIPDELQVILANQSPRLSVRSVDDTLSFRPTTDSPDAPRDVSIPVPESESSGEPETVELPVFHLIDVNDNRADLDDMMDVDEDDTKKSFDFTGELQKLNESGGSDRASFVEQLEKAFQTPAKIDLRYDFGGQLGNGFLQVDVPPLPPLPSMVSSADSSSSMDVTDDSISSQDAHYGGSTQTASESLEEFPLSRLLDAKEPTLLPGSDSVGSDESHDLPHTFIPKGLKPSTSSSSRPSDGELNKAFKFGGFSKSPSLEIQPEKPITLSDIIPPLSRVRAMSDASYVDDSVIDSIMAKASDMPAARPRLTSDSSMKRRARDDSAIAITRNIAYRHSRHDSTSSFNGFDSFEEVRRGFEFHDYRPAFYPPPVSSGTRRNNHSKQDSMMSFASISSYGHVVNSGIPDPFDYGLPSLRERPSSEDMTSTSFSMSVDDTFSFLRHAAPLRRRVDSDASSFYFNAPAVTSRGHRRRESNMSVVSQGPPISLYNRSFGHRRNDSSTSVSSMAHSYAVHGANGGRAAWAQHKHDASVDSVESQFSAMRLGRPDIGDKMFDTAGNFGAPLPSISASPPGTRTSYDSIMDGDQRSSMDDSLFDKTGHRTSVSSDSVFGYEDSSHDGHLLPPTFRPISSLSINSIHSPMKEDDTMISMIGGGHVRRRSVGSVIEASPCVRAVGHLGKRKQAPFENLQSIDDVDDGGHAIKARIVEKASIVSTSSSKFGGERMIRARRGILERQSLEESCLIAEGEDLSASFSLPVVFSRPSPTTRSRSSTCTSSSSGGDTPPLSASDGSSTSEGSQSSIDLAHLNRILSNATHPVSNISRQRDRARARGEGHRRRISQARASRSSVYETIEEELYSPNDTPLSRSTASKKSSPTVIQPVFIVDPSDSASIHSMDSWDEERGIVAMRRYYELRSEAEYTVNESKRLWVDTPFSVFALQNFDPPRHPSGMQALLASSVQSYGPLPSELRPLRRRTSSRPSPYPQGRTVRVSLSPDCPRPAIITEPSPRVSGVAQNVPLKEVVVNANLASNSPVVPLASKVFSREMNSPEKPLTKRENVRPRVASTARRTALGWSKRSAKASSELKENANSSFGQGMGMTPGNTSLRFSRPRPRGRPTPARPSVRV
ncbi:hypothetical protein BDP27DRAFT_1424922 [Rhodocollybia butyracea]|uniref:Uncharacterized protein n=1 Tax=Rhodocollybia butyracea TaxID=206335 RepID=A0A9P5U490_9AGAR|nr:hypothetical protein BDP27DRAFT_1424922 [Rhodocollybia butyracea]